MHDSIENPKSDFWKRKSLLEAWKWEHKGEVNQRFALSNVQIVGYLHISRYQGCNIARGTSTEIEEPGGISRVL
jgi:hypothetical protein